MVTLKRYDPKVRAARPYPTPKRKPARLSPQSAKAMSRSMRKPKSR